MDIRTLNEELEKALAAVEQIEYITKEQINADIPIESSGKIPMFEMPMKNQVGYQINRKDFPNLLDGDLQSQIDNLVNYVDKTKNKYLKGYVTTIPLRHIEKTDNLEHKTYSGDVYLSVGNCEPDTDKIIECYYEKQQGLYHMKNGGHWNDCKKALSKEMIEIFQKCNDIDFGIDRIEHKIDKTKLEVHTREFTYVIALACSQHEETVLLTVYKETTKERNIRRTTELKKGRKNRH